MPDQRDVLGEVVAEEPRLDPRHLPVEVTPAWFPDPKGTGRLDLRADFHTLLGSLSISGQARLIDGALVLTQLLLEVSPADENAGSDDPPARLPTPAECITPDALRRVPVGRLLESVRREVLAQEVFDRLAPDFGIRVREEQRRYHRRAARALRGKTLRRGRPRLGDEHFRRVAEVALQLQSEGRSSLRHAIAEEFRVSEGTVRDWTRRARELEWLAPSRQGVRGVMPGPRLEEALAKEHDA
jgi:hypothetical protein